MNIVVLEEPSISPAAKHQVSRQLTAQFGARLRHQAGQPRDTLHFLKLGGHDVDIEDLRRRPALLHVEEVIAAHQLDGQRAVIAGFAFANVIFGVIEQMLRGDPVGGEEGELLGAEVVADVFATGLIAFHCVIIECTESVGKGVVLHVGTREATRQRIANQTLLGGLICAQRLTAVIGCRVFSRRRFLLTSTCMAAGLLAGVTPAWARSGPRTHTVQKGETLSQLAERYGVSIAALRTRNKITGDTIKIGQRLVIPGIAALDGVIDATKSLRITRGRWQHVVVHHSGIEDGNAKAYDSAHHRRGMDNGLAYHFVIGNGRDSEEGGIELGPRWLKQLDGGHVRSREFNAHGIGVCLVGNFEERRPSTKQMESLTALIDWLRDDAPLGAKPKFTVHRWVDKNHTVCPGKFFPSTRLRLRYA